MTRKVQTRTGDRLTRSNLEEEVAVVQGNGGYLNPDWVEWLMGWPIGWTRGGELSPQEFQEWEQSFRIRTPDFER